MNRDTLSEVFIIILAVGVGWMWHVEYEAVAVAVIAWAIFLIDDIIKTLNK